MLFFIDVKLIPLKKWYLLWIMKACIQYHGCVHAQSCLPLCDPTDSSPPGSSGDSPGKNTGVGCHSLLQRIFPTQGLNLGLLHCRQSLPPYHLGRSMYWILHSVISTLPGSSGYSMLSFCISHSKRTLENLSRQFPAVWMKLSPKFFSYDMPSY